MRRADTGKLWNDVQMIEGEPATWVRQAYVSHFVSQDSEYFRSRTRRLQRDSGGSFYDGYLWDCLRHPELVREDAFLEELNCHGIVYVMTDLHSDDKVQTCHYWRFPKPNVLVLQAKLLPKLLPLLPDDLYVFDASLCWSLIVIHEIYEDGSTICYRATPVKQRD